ncbi:MAG: hypothetical protein JJ864_07535 [Rhizobiaceae bacterium]|nr:hypothetical protein [Rhizobiaceae bacterium]
MDDRIAFTPRQAAEAASLTEPQIWGAITSQKLQAHMAGDRVVILRTDLERFVASLPNPLDGYDSVEAHREAELRDHAAKRERGRKIATTLMTSGSLPGDPGFERGKAIAAKLLGRSQKT